MVARMRTKTEIRCNCLLAMLLAACALVFAPVSASAQEDIPGASYITPFPTNDVYQLQVMGDYMAEGLLYGLTEAFGEDKRLQIERRHRTLSGLMRPDFEEELRDLESELQTTPRHIVIVMFGVQDRVSVRVPNGKRLAVGSEEWRAEYSRRVDKFIKMLRRRNVAVYWVGLPNLRRPESNDDAQMMNEVIRERVYLNGLKYIDAYAGFLDENGAFSPYGPDLTGKIRLLREGDGIYFTAAGNRKLANFVERELKRDLTQAKNERSVPLAGNETEQQRINPDKVDDAAKPASGNAAGGPDKAPKSTSIFGSLTSPAPDTSGDLKADPGRVSLKTISPSGREEVVTIDIVRPAIASNVVALVTRRESPDKPSQMGDVLVDQIAGGLSTMSSITPAADATGGVNRRKLSPTQAPFYRILVKGERLTPRSGRVDDASWPRQEAAVQPPPAPAAAAPVPPGPGKFAAPQVEPGAKR